jgi:magnesium-transporting ATPase (P-type)
MIHALECKHFNRGLFQVNLWDNKVLLWCAVVLILATFPVVYIPTINDKVFLIGSLTWEWGIIVTPTSFPFSSTRHFGVSLLTCAVRDDHRLSCSDRGV